jgi:hypothetical protein
MSAPNSLIAPATAANTTDFDATECDKFLAVVTGVGLAGGETIQVRIPTTDNSSQPIFDPTLTAAFNFTATSTRVLELEGGFLYRFVKSGTAGNVGLDVCLKPRQA